MNHLVENDDQLDELLDLLPQHIENWVYALDPDGIIEIVLDYGRPPEVRYLDRTEYMHNYRVTDTDLKYVLHSDALSRFGHDNRAGIEGTLHRISAIRNRHGDIDGLTMRVGRLILGTIDLVQDMIDSGESILFLGRPGVGKTSKLRDACRHLSTDLGRRVIIVDSSNEIGGEGRSPHPAVGLARRMMVPQNRKQYEIMREAVENHMPQVIAIDEISEYDEALAARTIGERGVQLLASAHGDTLQNLVENDPLAPILGRLRTSTLSDENANRKNNGRKTVIERASKPTFTKLVEIRDFNSVAIYHNVADAVDSLLQGHEPRPELRRFVNGKIKIDQRFFAPKDVEEKSFTRTYDSPSPMRPIRSSRQKIKKSRRNR